MEALRIFIYAVAALGSYGLMHDLITQRLSQGWGWLPGVVMGVVYGVGLAATARSGSRPRRDAKSLLPMMLFLVIVVACFSLAAYVISFLIAKSGGLKFNPAAAPPVPPQERPAFIACGLAHMAAWYMASVLGGIQVAYVWLARRRRGMPATNQP